MKDVLSIIAILLTSIIVVGTIVLMGYHFRVVELVLIGIIVSTIGIILFIKFFPGEDHQPPENGK